MRILSYNITHDSSVCVLNNGEIEFFGKEERFSKIKRDSNPIKSLIAYFENYPNQDIDYSLFLTPSLDDINESSRTIFETIIKKYRRVKTYETFCENSHHDLHAWLAYVNSKFDKSLVFVVDRNGACLYTSKNSFLAREAESIFLFDQKNKCKPVYKNYWCSSKVDPYEIKHFLTSNFQDCDIKANSSFSIVKVYEAATTLIGQHPLENGKTMGLSSYGKKIDHSYFDLDGNIQNSFFIHNKDNLESVVFKNYWKKITKEITKDNFQFYADRALEVQTQTQQQVLNLIEKYTNLYQVYNVCIVGGYGLNVVANNFYIKNLPKINFYFEPVADDTGITIGACYKKYFEVTSTLPVPVKDTFFHFYNEKEKLRNNIGKKVKIKDLVDLLVNQKSLGIFNGAPEAGPRALGHRSILFDPREYEARNIVNNIKKREWYRPFAGVILRSEFKKYFFTEGLNDSPHMTINFTSNEEGKNLFPAVIHVDGSCRIQTIDKEDGFLYNLLLAFYNVTGCPVLLNTSLNLAGRPLIQTKQDAIQLLNNSKLDYIYFDDEKVLLNA